MKIVEVVAEPRSVRKNHPVRDALQLLDQDGHCVVRIRTDEGVEGVSDTYFGRVASSPALLATMVTEQLGPAIIGRDPGIIREIRRDLQALTDYHGTAGFSTFGLSAIDVALWDLLGKTLEVPVWKLLGPQRTSIPTYAMVGWLELGITELENVAAQAMEQGFRGVKMKVGGGSLGEDIRRIETVRAVIGDETPLMVDANQDSPMTRRSGAGWPTRISGADGSKNRCWRPTQRRMCVWLIGWIFRWRPVRTATDRRSSVSSSRGVGSVWSSPICAEPVG